MTAARPDTLDATPPATGAVARWSLRLAVGVMVVAGLALIFLLVQATNNRLLYERYYARLLWINVVAAAVLALVVLWGIYRLLARLRRGKFGSRLLIKLAAIFGLVGVVPGLLIYVVSYQFVARSIESWFDVRVEGALESGLTLARTSLDTQAREFASQLRAASAELAVVPDAAATLPLERLRAQIGASDVSLWGSSGRLIASAGLSRFDLTPERPSAQLARTARTQGVATQIEGIDDIAISAAAANPPAARIRAVAAINARTIGLLQEPRLIQAVQPLPAALVTHALAVQEAYQEYQERALGREGLRRMYIGTLTLALFLAVFGAVLLAVLLGKQLVTPLLLLADGVRQVAAGDLRPKLALPGRDELGGLTRSFANMTEQLADARAAVNAGLREVDAARAHLQTILDNLTAGVIVLDAAGRIQSTNPGATRILRAPLGASVGQPLRSLARLDGFADEVQQQFSAFEGVRAEHGLDHWQKAFELYGGGEGANAEAVSLVARGAALPGGLRLLVFDDISEIVSAQRTQAWAEVARRLAHEIKNPLTPIQLSAERLERRLADKLPEADRAMLVKSVQTIVDQVDAMKRLVNEFRDYARLPSARLVPLDLNHLVTEVLHLYGNAAEGAQAGGPVALQLEIDPACPPILGDAQQLRQVIHNLVQNALDASESAQADQARTNGEAAVLIRTHWSESTGRVRLGVIDHGHGFPEAVLKRAFEPYVTTKAKGTGLGLAVVKKIAEEHGARVDVSNRIVDGEVRGAQVSLTFDPASPAAALAAP